VSRKCHRDAIGPDALLRSRGSLSEQSVPFLFSRRTAGLPDKARMRNVDITDVALNHLHVS
jgi:phosphonoacetate hydrolase